MASSKKYEGKRLLKMVGLSLVVHIGLVVFLSLSPWPSTIKAHPIIYTVTLMPIAAPEPKPPAAPPPAPREKAPVPVEKPKPPPEKPVVKLKKDDIVEKIKKVPPKKEKEEEKKVPLHNLQDALEEIRKKAAIDEIKKKVARRETTEEHPTVTPPVAPPVPAPKPSPSPPAVVTPTAPSVSAPKAPPPDSKMAEYYSLVWAKIKEAWTIPENLLKEMVDMETVIIIIIERDGRIRKIWFEKKSGNGLYDQMAERAIKKADPLPPIPKELGENHLELGIRFTPD
jgi:TonB family protein